MATSLGPQPGTRHSNCQRDNFVPPSSSHTSNSRLPGRSQHRLSGQRRPLPDRLQLCNRPYPLKIRMACNDGDCVADGSGNPLDLHPIFKSANLSHGRPLRSSTDGGFASDHRVTPPTSSHVKLTGSIPAATSGKVPLREPSTRPARL